MGWRESWLIHGMTLKQSKRISHKRQPTLTKPKRIRLKNVWSTKKLNMRNRSEWKEIYSFL